MEHISFEDILLASHSRIEEACVSMKRIQLRNFCNTHEILLVRGLFRIKIEIGLELNLD